jgi:hypothetical protein
VVVVAVLHGLVHLLGAAEDLSWADVPQLTQPIGALAGALWLVAGVLLLATGALPVPGADRRLLERRLGRHGCQRRAARGDRPCLGFRRGEGGRVTSAEASTAPAAARTVRADWAALASIGEPTGQFSEDAVAGLPEPARRWLTHAIAPDTPLWRSVELRMRGHIRLGTWRPFTARQVLAPPHGFIWSATARVAGLPVSGFDRYSSATGQLRWRLLGLIPVMSAAGPDVTRSAAGRLAGEGLCWLPTSFPAAAFTDGPHPDTAAATWRIGDQAETVLLRVDPHGALRELRMQRWGNPDGEPFGRYPFGVAVDAERTFAGVTVPSTVRAGWWWGTDRQEAGEFFRAEVTEAVYR